MMTDFLVQYIKFIKKNQKTIFKKHTLNFIFIFFFFSLQTKIMAHTSHTHTLSVTPVGFAYRFIY